MSTKIAKHNYANVKEYFAKDNKTFIEKALWRTALVGGVTIAVSGNVRLSEAMQGVAAWTAFDLIFSQLKV